MNCRSQFEQIRNALNQILKNLLSNAVKFTEQGGIVVNLSKYSDSKINIAITDTGIGIMEK